MIRPGCRSEESRFACRASTTPWSPHARAALPARGLDPPELRRGATELATTRQRGAAQLEPARAETAALRSMADGARLLAANPALATLRMIQSAPPGTELVLRFDGSAVAGSADPADGTEPADGPGV
ncbi:MAG: hypothetical protein ABI112_12895 [Terracoccus sp.]